jgi:hypothetical protein
MDKRSGKNPVSEPIVYKDLDYIALVNLVRNTEKNRIARDRAEFAFREIERRLVAMMRQLTTRIRIPD